MNKLILALAVLSVSLVAAPAETAKKDCAPGQCKADKACPKKDCKAGDKKACTKDCEKTPAAKADKKS